MNQKPFISISSSEEKRITRVLEHYFLLKEKLEIKKSITGVVNKVYLVVRKRKKYIFRESRRGADYAHILLESELLRFLRSKHFSLSPRIIQNRFGQDISSYRGLHYTLQTFLPGSMVFPRGRFWYFMKEPERLKDFFRTSAKFTRAVRNFCPRTKTKTVTLADDVFRARSRFQKSIKKLPASPGKRFLIQNKDNILDFIEKTKAYFENSQYNDLPKQLVHFDFHPGNVHFQGKRISGIFDYDWVRFDSRFSDIASAIFQACCDDRGPRAGVYEPRRIKIGLAAYRKAYGESGLREDVENHLVMIALRGYALFQLLFILDEYQTHIHNREYLLALDRSVKIICRNNFEALFRF